MSLDDGTELARRNEALGLPVGVQLAPIWRRVLAQILDQLVVIVPVVGVALLLGVRNSDDLADHTFAINTGVVLSAFSYEFVMIALWGRTVGKFALGTRVVRIDTGGPLLWWSSAIRALVPLAAGVVPAIGTFLSLIVYAGAFWDRRRQGWHDKAAGTIVVLAR
ncbi:MAG: hypothetical protein JWN62_4054 [Acidimicrobiales bacterium]|nr:hypothetical protein [Acidimicrobiales bacterium]